MKSALITGVTGQDGAYLARFLLDKGYRVFGTYRRLSTPNFWRLQDLGILDKVSMISIDLIDSASLVEAVRKSEPEEIYNLAAQSFVGASFEQPIGACEVTGLGVTRMLEVVRQIAPDARFYQASTSEMYGNGGKQCQSESTIFTPCSPYAAAKLYGYWITSIYREGYGIFASNGILFNHESPLRGLEFVTRKITNSVAKIKLGIEDELRLGNLDSKRDWGYAPEFVECMWKMLQQDSPDDFVIATGETHSVREFVEAAFGAVDIDYEKHVKIDKRFMRPLDVNILCGDSTKAKKELDWQPKTKFKDLVEIMVKADLKRWERFKKGEHFAWDAVNYPNENNLIPSKIKLDR